MKFIRSDRRWRRGRELSRRSCSRWIRLWEARAYISKVLRESTRIRPARLHCKLYEILFTMRRLRGQLILRLKMEYPLAILMLVLIKYSHSKMYISRKAFSSSRKTDWLFWRVWNFGAHLFRAHFSLHLHKNYRNTVDKKKYFTLQFGLKLSKTLNLCCTTFHKILSQINFEITFFFFNFYIFWYDIFYNIFLNTLLISYYVSIWIQRDNRNSYKCLCRHVWWQEIDERRGNRIMRGGEEKEDE